MCTFLGEHSFQKKRVGLDAESHVSELSSTLSLKSGFSTNMSGFENIKQSPYSSFETKKSSLGIQRRIEWMARLWTSALFAAGHLTLTYPKSLTSPEQYREISTLIRVFVLDLMLESRLRLLRGNLWASIGAHMSWNSFIFLVPLGWPSASKIRIIITRASISETSVASHKTSMSSNDAKASCPIECRRRLSRCCRILSIVWSMLLTSAPFLFKCALKQMEPKGQDPYLPVNRRQ